MKRKFMPSEYIAETYSRLSSKYMQHYANFSKEPIIKNPLSVEKKELATKCEKL